MKRLLTLALCTASLMAALSCVKDRPKDSTIKAKTYNYFEAVSSAASITADAGIVTLDISSNVPWTLKADEGLVPDVTQGTGNASVKIAVPENLSFSARSFSWSVSTEAELDVDEPGKWTVFGRTLDFTLTQDGILPKLSVDESDLKLPASAVSAIVTLSANIEYSIECKSEKLTCSVEVDEDNPFRHYLSFSFPANESAEAVEYRAEIIPTRTDIPGVAPIEIVIRQAALKLFRLDCTDASLFRYSDGDAALAIRTSSIYNTVTAPFSFYIEQGGVKYPFYGQVSCWTVSGSTACLSNKSSTTVKLPSIEGYILQEVEVTYSHSTTMITYSVTDGKDVLGSCNRVRSTTEKTIIDLSGVESTSDERFLKASREMCVKFILTYSGVE
jgi:hypothetical protein